MNDFTIDDLNVLLEAMEAWETKDSAGELMSSLVGAMLMPKDAPSDQRERYESERAADKAKYEETRQQRKERSVLLRAKLIQMLDTARAERLTA